MTTSLDSQKDRQCDGAPSVSSCFTAARLSEEVMMKESTKLGNGMRAMGPKPEGRFGSSSTAHSSYLTGRFV